METGIWLVILGLVSVLLSLAITSCWFRSYISTICFICNLSNELKLLLDLLIHKLDRSLRRASRLTKVKRKQKF